VLPYGVGLSSVHLHGFLAQPPSWLCLHDPQATIIAGSRLLGVQRAQATYAVNCCHPRDAGRARVFSLRCVLPHGEEQKPSAAVG
jgi:hypothetical protein